MLTDTLTNLSCYRGMHSNLDAAIDWLQSHDLAMLPDGRTVIDEEQLFINVMDVDLHEAEGAMFEYHRRYADLQIDLTGSEHWGWAAAGEPVGDFDADADIGFAAGPEHAGGVLGEGRFVLFLPQEQHKPGCKTPGCSHVRKAVLKIKME